MTPHYLYSRIAKTISEHTECSEWMAYYMAGTLDQVLPQGKDLEGEVLAVIDFAESNDLHYMEAFKLHLEIFQMQTT